jgi:hypothetical protein
MTPSDSVPLGVSGVVTVPLRRYVGSVGREPGRDVVLVDETARIAYVARRLSDAFDRPLTSSGSSGLARAVLSCFHDVDVLSPFARKVIETLRDGTTHSLMAVSPDDPRAAVQFVAWSGTHRDVMPVRRGHYLQPLLATAGRITQGGVQLAGFLEIDAYAREHAEAKNPGKPLNQVFEIDVEFSYLPGVALGTPSSAASALPQAFLINPDLCSSEERQLLSKLTARRG